jgi:ribonuclease-3
MVIDKGSLVLPDLNTLQQVLDISFNDRSLLEQALVHNSYSNENPAFTAHSNERLEFLGDAVLGLIIAERLHSGLPRLSEGEMTRLRSSLVRQSCLARIAATISLGNYLYLGKGEEAGGGRNKPKNLAATLEAVIAAVYLDQGPAITREFVLGLFDTELDKVLTQSSGSDYKSQLQEFTQAKWQLTPTYHLVAAVGPDHDKTFTVEVRIADTVLAKGSGKSKKTAETEAARAALRRVFTQ